MRETKQKTTKQKTSFPSQGRSLVWKKRFSGVTFAALDRACKNFAIRSRAKECNSPMVWLWGSSCGDDPRPNDTIVRAEHFPFGRSSRSDGSDDHLV